MTPEKIKKVIINSLRILEENIMQNQLKIAELLALFNKESISIDGRNHIKRLKK